MQLLKFTYLFACFVEASKVSSLAVQFRRFVWIVEGWSQSPFTGFKAESRIYFRNKYAIEFAASFTGCCSSPSAQRDPANHR